MKDLTVSAAAVGECDQIRSRIVERLAEPHFVTLRVNLSDFAIPGDLSLEKTAFVQVRSVRDRLNLNQELTIEFVPASSATGFPKFRGTLDVVPGEKEGETIVELRGSYEPPFGIAGAAFDAAVGNLIAQRTMTTFLHDILADGGNVMMESNHVNH